MNVLTRQNLRTYIKDSLQILRTSLQLIHRGQTPFYRVAAVQLRLLLCDTTRRHGRVISTALLPQWDDNIQFHTLSQDVLSNESPPELNLDNWLQQTAFSTSTENLSIRDLIRRICEQDGGAHVDPKPNQGIPPGFDPVQWTVNITDYIVTYLEITLILD